MKSFKRALLYSLFIWLIVFATAFLLFPIHESNRPLFESIMPIALSLTTSFFAFRYLSKVESNFIREGLFFGIVVMVFSWLIDAALMLTPSPMQMTLSEYIQDIGLTYLMILPITVGFGFIASYSKTIIK